VKRVRAAAARSSLSAIAWADGRTYLAACRTDADACVSYLWRWHRPEPGRKPRHRQSADPAPRRKRDKFIDKDAQKAIHGALDSNPHVNIYDYPGQDHAFARAFGHSRNEEAADLADKRTRGILRQDDRLTSSPPTAQAKIV